MADEDVLPSGFSSFYKVKQKRSIEAAKEEGDDVLAGFSSFYFPEKKKLFTPL